MPAPFGPLRIEPTPLISPIPSRERIEVIDILHGFALFGVLLINMRNFDLPGRKWTGTVDQVALWLTIFFGDSKFWTVFSFLFGLGFALQLERLEARGAHFLSLYLRRLTVVLFFGALHHLIYNGDILFEYAVAGFVLLLFRKRSLRTILLVAAVCFLIPLVEFSLDVRAREFQRAHPPTPQEAAREAAQRKAEDELYIRVYSRGSQGSRGAQCARLCPVLLQSTCVLLAAGLDRAASWGVHSPSFCWVSPSAAAASFKTFPGTSRCFAS